MTSQLDIQAEALEVLKRTEAKLREVEERELREKDSSLRDYFAAYALLGLLAENRRGQGEPGLWFDAPADKGLVPPDARAWIPPSHANLWAVAAYRLADAMVAERKAQKV